MHIRYILSMEEDFPSSSVGKESTCNEGDPGLIPGSRRPGGEGTSYPLQYSWVSLIAQLVKNLPAMQKTPVWFLGWEDPLEKGQATYSSILGLPWWAQMVKKPPAMWETSVGSLGWEDPWRKKWLPTPVFWPVELYGLYSLWDCKESARLSVFHFTWNSQIFETPSAVEK